MSWRETIEAPGITAGPSPYETARFGLRIDRITVSVNSRATEEELVDAVRSSGADVIIVRYPADRVTWFAALAAQGRAALFADTLVYWRLTAGIGRRTPRPSSTDIIPVSDTAGGTAITEALVGEIFADYRNHYTANPLFDHDRVRAGYQEWACRSLVSGRSIMMCERDDQGTGRDRDRDQAATSVPIGMSVGEVDGERVEILLAGVVPHAQGRGMYGHLLAAMEDLALDEGADAMVISTQGHNTRVQRAWARYGFEPVHALVTVHLVRPELLADGSAGNPR